MSEIFVSYRRDDSQWSAGRINDSLRVVFGAERIFFDTITIEPGDDFVEVLGAKVGTCRVLLAVIGPKWLEMLRSHLDHNNDFVRIEIAEALRRGVRVVPVLIDGAAPLPEGQLPDDLKALARRNAVWIRAQTFPADVGSLVDFLKRYLDQSSPGAQPSAPSARATPAIPATPQLPAPGSGKTKWFKDFDAGPEMVVVPAGVFLMGSRAGEGRDDERPQHTVRIPKPFAVSRFAITFAEWDAAVREGGVEHMCDDQGWGRGRRPVINVSWLDAMQYVAWLSGKTGETYRLLSEAEWEYCCRAGAGTAYSFGPSITDKQANFSAKQTVEVGKFPANDWGLHDMHGYVWEWVEDCWHDTYNGAPGDGSPWTAAPAEEHLRVVRGGSWLNTPENLRSAVRFRFAAGDRNLGLGFRVGRSVVLPRTL